MHAYKVCLEVAIKYAYIVCMHMKLNEQKMRIVRDVDEDASVVAIIDKDKDNAKFLDERDLKLWYYSYRE